MPTQPSTTSKPATTPYDADALYHRLVAAIGVAPIILFSGDVGTGKSTVLASAPVENGKNRTIFDHEDSMPYLDAGLQGVDLYTPAHQKFRMRRKAFPELEDYAALYAAIKSDQHSVGVLEVDNIKLLQDQMVEKVISLSATPPKLKEFMAKFDSAIAVPAIPSRVTKWANATDAAFWEVVKAPFKNILLLCKRKHIMFLGSTEQGNVWQNYGGSDQKVIGKKGKILDVWLRYADAMVFLSRDVNKRGAPTGAVNPHQTKMRIQGLNPTWEMDWPNFIGELEAAKQRTDEAIPESAKVVVDVTSDEPEAAPVKAQQQ